MNNDLTPYSIPKTLTQSLYAYLKNAIINNKLKANQKINEVEIAQFFGVSKTPVREAVLMLGIEGFVDVNSHRDAVVKGISYDELKEIFQVMGILDSMGSCLSLDNLNLKNIIELEAFVEEMERYCQVSSIEKYISLNMDFHQKIWDLIPNNFLKRTLQFVKGQLLRYNFLGTHVYSMPGILERSMNEHRIILDLVKKKNKRKLKMLILKHWGSPLRANKLEEGIRDLTMMEVRRK